MTQQKDADAAAGAPTTETIRLNNELRGNDKDSAPPAYDTLSLRPPSVSAPTHAVQSSGRRKASFNKVKQKYQELKEENEQRKAERLIHVTHGQANKIMGKDDRNDENGRARGVMEIYDMRMPGPGLV